jgi:hypothetical protein
MTSGSNNDGSGQELGSRVGVGIAIGTGFGVALGLVLDNLALGIAIGVALGSAIGAALSQGGAQRPVGTDATRRLGMLVLLGAAIFLGVVGLVAFLLLRGG